MDKVRVQGAVIAPGHHASADLGAGIACVAVHPVCRQRRVQVIDLVRLVLIAVSTSVARLGREPERLSACFTAPRLHDNTIGAERVTKRTAILVPVYNEDPAETFSRVLAMDRALVSGWDERAVRFRHPVGYP